MRKLGEKNVEKQRQNKKRKEAAECAGRRRAEGTVCNRKRYKAKERGERRKRGERGKRGAEGCRCVYKSADGKRRDVQAQLKEAGGSSNNFHCQSQS